MKGPVLMGMVGCALLLASCASGRYLAEGMARQTDAPDAAVVHVMRKSQIVGCSMKMGVCLDAKMVAQLGPGERLELRVLPGEHFLETGLASKHRWFTGDTEVLSRFDAEPRKTYYFLCSMAMQGERYRLTQLTGPAGKKELSAQGYDLLTTDD